MYHRDHEGAEAAREELGDAAGLTMLPADLTDDDTVDISDLLQMIGLWGPCPLS